MKLNEGRQSAYVTSRVVDKSNIQSPTEYLPLFTCLAPKGNSTDPVLIRDEDSLIEEFGDPSINPDFYCDLVTIRDFVKSGKSCWVNRVAVEAQKFHYVFYLNNTIPVTYKLYFKYPLWGSLTPEEKNIANCGYYPNGSANIRFQSHTGEYLDIPMYKDIYPIIARADEIYAKTGWQVIIPDNPLVNISKKHNSIQQYSAAVINGQKYINMRWQASYDTEEDRKLTTTYYNLPMDSTGKLIRKSDGSLPTPIDDCLDTSIIKVIPVTKIDDNNYQYVSLNEGEYYRSGVRLVCDHSEWYFYKASAVTLRKRTVYSVPDTSSTPVTSFVDGETYYTNEKEGCMTASPKWETFVYDSSLEDPTSVIPNLVIYRMYYSNASSSRSNYYYNKNFEVCDSYGNIILSLGAHRVYVDDKIILDKLPRTLHIGENETRDISTYMSAGTWGSIDSLLRNVYGITINYPDGFSPSETSITSMDISLISKKENIDLLLFNMDSLLFNPDRVLTFTSIKPLIPASAGIKINYVLNGVDMTSTEFLITESITLPDKFTDGQFAKKMNQNPYLTLTVEDPNSNNIYNAMVSSYINSMEYTYTYNTSFEINASHYQESIKKYMDPKYNGCFLCDLCYPCLELFSESTNSAYRIVSMTPDDRRAIHYIIKSIASIRKNLICILTTPNLSLDEACDWVAAKNEYKDYWEYGNKNAIDYSEQSFYCEMYYGWLSYRTALVDGSPYKIKELPSNIFVIRNIIESWINKGISYPVAGDQGGVINSNTALMNILNNPDTKPKKDKLVSYRINPIVDKGTRGIQIYGNETLSPLYTDLSAAHIARMLVMIKSQVDAYTETIKFSLNNQYTWGSWINYVNQNILDPLKAQGGLVWSFVDMGYNTTSKELIAQKKVKGILNLQFQQDLEIIDLEFLVESSSIELSV